MDLTLYEAAAHVRELLDQIDPETGELPEEFDQARAIVATKAASVAAYILETDKQAAMVEAAGKDLIERAKTQRRRIDWLKQYLAGHMAACEIREIKDARGLFAAKLEVGRDEAVEVFDAAQVPADYMREIPARSEPDKLLLKRAMKDGYEIPGAKLVKRDRLVLK